MPKVCSRVGRFAAGVLLLSAATAGLVGCATDSGLQASAAKGSGEIVGLRRLTEAQYRQSITDIFGAGIKVSGRFEPEVRRDGLIAIGSGEASISPSGMEQYYAMAASIAEQAVAPDRRAKLPCQPQSAKAADDACAAQVVRQYGRLLFRRPLATEDVAKRVQLANRVATEEGDFYGGLKEALTSLLGAPDFLFRLERAAGPAKAGVADVDAYTRASRLSFLFWNTTPDDELLKAAESGELMTDAGLTKQVERLSSSKRLGEGVGAFFDDMMQLEAFSHQSKDPQFFPKYSGLLAVQAREQTVRTLVDLLVTRNGDYRDIFTTRDTFMTRTLAMVYKVPYTARADWAPYTFKEDSGRSGVITQISFLSLFSHPARSSPTKRGVALNEIFLCESTPSPPGNVDFSLVTGEAGMSLKTVRLRLEAHATDETCASCHTAIDPPGLTLERFDSLGELRERENGELIDVRSEIDGRKIEGAAGLGQLLHENPRVAACVVKNLYATGTGHAVEAPDKPAVAELTKAFAAGGYRLPAFMKTMAASPAYYRVRLAPAPALPAAKSTKVAALDRPRVLPAKEAKP